MTNGSQDNPKISETKSLRESALPFIVFIIIVSVFVFLSSILVRTFTIDDEAIEKITEEKIIEIIKEKEIVITRPKCENTTDSFYALKTKGQVLQIVNNEPSHAVNKQFSSNIQPTVIISGQDDIACGYLYIKVSKNKKPLDEKYESIYINPQGFGGHILRNRGIVLNNLSGYTEALLSLDSISYLPNLPYEPNAQNFRIANWVNLLNVNSHVTFSMALSTLDKNALIEDISIVYKCWNSETGKETNGCQLGLEN